MKYVMVIDDSSVMRKSVEMVVRNAGHTVELAENGKEALEKIDALRASGDTVALCITDVNMPVMSGLQFLREFRKTERFTPVLVLTTEYDEGKLKEGREAGASGWLQKPFKHDELLNAITRVIG
jgi:two-component system chemotaxis response regulator CheY